jgi:hypothetical protein
MKEIMRWDSYEKAGRNPRTGETTTTQRRRLCTHEVLPLGDAYADFIRARLTD